MRKLLNKWAELDPDRCEKSSQNIFTIRADEEARNIYDPDDLAGLDLAWIGWAVQQAIVERGWSFELNYNPNCPDPNNPYDATVDSSKSGGWGFGKYNTTAPLLYAYLETMRGEIAVS